MAKQPQSLKELIHELAVERGLDLRGYKPTTLERRIRRRMQQIGAENYSDYLERIRSHPGEINDLLNTVLINVTRFFRDPPAWDALAREVLPGLLQSHPRGIPIRVWCAGCATGEEAYSVAILLAEQLNAPLNEYDIKIYATDIDDEALAIARRAEYAPEQLQGMRPEWREKYFTGGRVLHVTRDLRKLVIFGRSNLLTNAPISHVKLLICRNVLIYFNIAAQSQIMARLQYALEPGGILFLGKAESQLKRSIGWEPVNSKWRIFRKIPGEEAKTQERSTQTDMEPDLKERAQQELQLLKLYHQTVLETLEPGILVLDSRDVIITDNDAVVKLWGLEKRLVGQKIQESELWQRCPALKLRLIESRATGPTVVQFETSVSPETLLSITIKPIISDKVAGQVGTLIYMENVSPRFTLQTTIEELETTAEELQSSNEELETTNEELQSTNEELETTNEELQSTNEELETTNEELQSLNEELETTNEELSSRTKELDEVNARYSEVLERMPWPVLLVNDDLHIPMYNSAAQKLFGYATPSEKGMHLAELPLTTAEQNFLIRNYNNAIRTKKNVTVRNRPLTTNAFHGLADVHFIPLSHNNPGHSALIMFEIKRQSANGKEHKAAPKPAKKSSQERKK